MFVDHTSVFSGCSSIEKTLAVTKNRITLKKFIVLGAICHQHKHPFKIILSQWSKGLGLV